MAAAITVNTATDDFGSNLANCSLREAIQSTNIDANFGGCVATGIYNPAITDVITLPTLVSGGFTLTRIGSDDTNVAGDLDINGRVRIDGVSAANSVIRGDTGDPDNNRHRLLHVIGGIVTLNDLTLRDGLEPSAAGGGLRSEPGTTTVLNRVTVTANVSEGNAGGILNRGTMTINASLISNNRTRNAADGGGGVFVSPDAVMTINDSRILSNTTEGEFVRGGGIHAAGDLLLDNSVLDGNHADATGVGVGDTSFAEGGGVYSLGTLTVVQSTISNNSATANEGAEGGGVSIGTGIFSMDRVVITGNVASSGTLGGSGGGLSDSAGIDSSGVIQDSVISNNEARGGGIFARPEGGGLKISKTRVLRSTISDNRSLDQGDGGGVHMFLVASLSNTTVIGNSAEGDGGGIYVRDSSFTNEVRSSTIVQNIGNSDNNINGQTGGVHAEGLVRIGNSVLAGNLSGNDAGDCGGNIILSAGFNLVQGTCNLQNAAGDRDNVPAQLAAATNNGGPIAGSSLGIISGMLTRAPLPGSPLIDSGNSAGCSDQAGALLATDQIGRDRAIDGDGNGSVRCDTGAVEFEDAFANGFANGFE